ncbi:MAG: hypothetical protein AAFZ18_31175 [Myxococcota bacterium]
MLRPRTLPLAALLAIGALAGCGDDPIPLALLDFQASAQSVDAGQTVTLTWATSGASNIEVRQDPGAVIFSGADATGMVVSPELNLNTTFTLTISNADGETATRSVSVDVIGINIVSFTASPMTIGRGDASMLSWTLGGSSPSDVRLTDSQGQNVIQPGSNLMRQGSAMVQPNESETYTLFAQAGGVTAMATVTVTVASMPPTIGRFEARALIGGNVQVVTTVARNQQIQLFWELTNAEEVQISANGAVIRPWNTNGASPGGNVQARATEDTNEFLIEARNGPDPEDLARQTLVITTRDLPVVNSFSVSPLEYTRGSTVATATWETTNADGTLLQVGGQNVPNFSRETTGSFQFSVTGEANVTLIARNAVGDAVQTERIRFGFNEPEPNDTTAQAIPLPADGVEVRGTLTSTTDVDVYSFMVPEGAGVFARVDDEMGTNCANLDPSLTLLDPAGAPLGTRDTSGLTRCAEILPPEFAGWAGNLAAGTYHVAVRRPPTSTAQRYRLTLRLIVLDPPLPNVTITRVGAPDWEPTDFVSISVPFGAAADMFPDLPMNVARILGTRHTSTLSNLTVVSNPNLASPSDFSLELRTMAAALGYPNRGTLAAADWNEPRGHLFGYTLVPSATATTGTSRDFPVAPGGPVISDRALPINVGFALDANGEVFDEIPGSPAPVLREPTLDGISHAHVIHEMASGFFPMPPALPATLQWILTLRDATNAGYDINFTVNVNAP